MPQYSADFPIYGDFPFQRSLSRRNITDGQKNELIRGKEMLDGNLEQPDRIYCDNRLIWTLSEHTSRWALTHR
jgi:hypothetical protein